MTKKCEKLEVKRIIIVGKIYNEDKKEHHEVYAPYN